MLRILAPVDGSASSTAAIENLVRSIKDRGAVEVHVLHVQLPLHRKIAAIAQPGLLERVRADEAREATAAAERLLKTAGVPHAVVVETGNPAETIALYAKVHGCDEIVMGTRGLGALQGVVVGSVTTKVLHAVTIPVKLVKQAAPREPARAAA